jgi:2'-5' RNA ligase
MDNSSVNKRLFFGIEVSCPWPEKYPKGRLLDPIHRHMTLAFLGNVDYQKVLNILPSFPKIPLKIGIGAFFDKCLFLPPRDPHVVAWHVDWLDNPKPLLTFQQALIRWLKDNHFFVDEREFLPHVTIARSPFYASDWKQVFNSLPCMCTSIHLYESIGNLCYEPLWTLSLKVPFEEIEHTADIAFKIHGEHFAQLYTHAQLALAFRFPAILPYLKLESQITSVEDIVVALNKSVMIADGQIGCPYKAVSFHGKVLHEEDGTLTWEMIVDV